MNVCIFGASSDHLDPGYYQAAERFGRLAASDGHTVIFGGGAGGMMGACARGVQAAGGHLIGIAPRMFDEPGFLLENCDQMIFTDTLAERKEKMFAMSDAFVSLPGGIGTMDEFFEAITLRQLGLLRGSLVLMNTFGYYSPLVSYLESMAEQGFMSRSCLSLIHLCDTPEDALAAISMTDELNGSIRRLEDYVR